MSHHYGGHNQGGDHFGAGREARLIAARDAARARARAREEKTAMCLGVRGDTFCSLPEGHPGECDFSRTVAGHKKG